MKRSILFLFIIIISFSLSAQKNNRQYNFKHQKEFGNFLIQKKAASYKSVSVFNQVTKSNLSNQFVNQRLDSAISTWFEPSISSFIPEDKNIFEYDSSGVILSNTDYNWDDNLNIWDLDDKEEYSFDSLGRVSVIIESWWDDNSTLWMSDYREEFTYNSNGDIELELEFEYQNDSIWVERWKTEYTYNGTDLELIFDYYWDYDSLNWQADSKFEFIYLGGVLTESYEYYWDNTYWKPDSKDVYTLDNNDNITEVVRYYWFSSVQAWKEGNKREYEYDTEGNPNLEVYYGWNSSDSIWHLDGKYEYSYNLAYSLGDLQLPPLSFFAPDYNNTIVNMPLGSEQCSWMDSIWFQGGINEYYYSEHEIVSILEYEETILQVYPNPASDKINISGNASAEPIKVEILDIRGRVILSETIQGNASIDTHEMHAGIYIYRISAASNILQTGKLVIE